MAAPVPWTERIVDEMLDNAGRHSRWRFWCPACLDEHLVDGGWAFNGNLTAPTFDPSIRVTYHSQGVTAQCHSQVTAGVIRYYGDSQHRFAGQELKLPRWADRRESMTPLERAYVTARWLIGTRLEPAAPVGITAVKLLGIDGGIEVRAISDQLETVSLRFWFEGDVAAETLEAEIRKMLIEEYKRCDCGHYDHNHTPGGCTECDCEGFRR